MVGDDDTDNGDYVIVDDDCNGNGDGDNNDGKW